MRRCLIGGLAALSLMLLASGANAQAGITPCAAKTLSVTTTTGNVALSTCGQTVILYNTTSQEAYFNVGTASNTAATTSTFYAPAGSYVVLQAPTGVVSYLAGITPTATTTFKIIQGQTSR